MRAEIFHRWAAGSDLPAQDVVEDLTNILFTLCTHIATVIITIIIRTIKNKKEQKSLYEHIQQDIDGQTER